MAIVALSSTPPAHARAVFWYADGKGNIVTVPVEKEPPASLDAAPESREAPTRAEAAPPSAAPQNASAASGKSGPVLAGGILALACMGIGSGSVIAAKLRRQSRLARGRHEARSHFKPGRQWLDRLAQGSGFHQIAKAGIDAMENCESRPSEAPHRHGILLSIQSAVGRIEGCLKRGLGSLIGVGVVAPPVGLLSAAVPLQYGDTTPVESLFIASTALAIALLALLCHRRLVRRNQALLQDLESFAAELQKLLLIYPDHHGTPQHVDCRPAAELVCPTMKAAPETR